MVSIVAGAAFALCFYCQLIGCVYTLTGGCYYSEHLPLLGDLRDLQTQEEQSAVPVAIDPHPINNSIVWTAATPSVRAPIVSSSAESDFYEESMVMGTVDTDDRVPLTGADEIAPRPHSVLPCSGGNATRSNTINRAPPRGAALSADLLCGGTGGTAVTTMMEAAAARLPLMPSSRIRQASVPRYAGGPSSSMLRLRPGAVIQLRLRSVSNGGDMATPTPDQRVSEVI